MLNATQRNSPAVLAWLILVLISVTAWAQRPAPQVFPNLELLTDGWVNAIARQPDGGVVFGGYFNKVNGTPRNNIARLRPDGTLDPDWNPSADGDIIALAIDASGAVYASGGFSSIGGTSRNYLAKLSGSGTGATDPDWNPSANSGVLALVVDASGAVYAGGAFTSIGGASRPFIAKLSGIGTGAADPDWNPSADNIVLALAVDASGAVYAGGHFSSIGGAPRQFIAKLSGIGTGAADPDWNPSANNGVFALTVDANGAVYAGGGFSSIGGASRQFIAKLSGIGTGAADPDWNPSANDQVRALAVDASGAVYAGGPFTSIGGTPRTAFAKLNPNGTTATSVANAPRFGIVHALAQQADGGLIVGGEFNAANGMERNYLLRVQPNGTLDPFWNPSADAEVRALAVDGSGAVYAGGAFTSIGGASRQFIAKLSGIGTGAADPDWNPSANSEVRALAMDVSGAVYAGGYFSIIGDASRPFIAKLSGIGAGAADPDWNPSANNVVYALSVDASGAVYAGGAFTSIGGASRTRIAKLSGNGTGAADPDWNPSANSRVLALAVDASGAVYAGGWFTSIGGASRARIAKLPGSGTGAADPDWNPSANSGVLALTVDDVSDSVYIGGEFTTVGNQPRGGLARILGDTDRIFTGGSFE